MTTKNTPLLFFPNSTMDFRELKKQLRDIAKIGNENQDVQGWATDIKLWIKLQDVTSPRTIYYGCLLTAQGDAQRLIEDLRELRDEESDEDDAEEETEEDNDCKVIKKLNLIILVQS